jgi:rare lipoprotein A
MIWEQKGGSDRPMTDGSTALMSAGVQTRLSSGQYAFLQVARASAWKMLEMFKLNPHATILLLSIVAVATASCEAHYDGGTISSASQDETPSRTATASTRPQPDLSGRTRFGDASFYAKAFAGRKMADGSKMDPHGDNAASKTLPLGTRARVTNIDSGQSAVVTIQDRGPYVQGRIVDLSPSTAQRIGITQDNGVAKVRVTPISVPLPDGSTKLGAEKPDSKP